MGGEIGDLFSQVAPTYDTVEPRFFLTIALGLATRLRLARVSSLLDVATGTGVVLSVLAEHAPRGLRMTGADISLGMVREARQRLLGAGVEANLCAMDATRLGFQNGSFDAVTISRAYLTARHAAALSEVMRVLRPGGQLAIAEFGDIDSRWQWKDELYARLLPAGEGRNARRSFDASIFARELNEAGFHDVSVESTHIDVVYHDLEHWWDSSMSHGERSALELIKGPLRERWFALADPGECREADGLLHWRPEVLYASCLRPKRS